MLIIQGKLISDDIVEAHFLCDLEACKGACCWEGDAGAPLEEAELAVLDEIYGVVTPYLSPAGREAIAAQGRYVYDEEGGDYATPLVDRGPCAYMILDGKGMARCGIEAAWQAGKIDFRKPISCHLYPIRIESNPAADFEALNYERWSICNAACAKGAAARLPIYRFVKDALIRKYGQDFYDELDAAATRTKE
ncbi:MAG: DUF3109 family protein [Lewinella sp.]|nr:DUF3109 family protein [Lewinella sp.]